MDECVHGIELQNRAQLHGDMDLYESAVETLFEIVDVRLDLLAVHVVERGVVADADRRSVEDGVGWTTDPAGVDAVRGHRRGVEELDVRGREPQGATAPMSRHDDAREHVPPLSGHLG